MEPHRERVEVTLLTAADCGHCEDAKRLLDQLAAEYPLQVATVDVASPHGQRLAGLGGVIFPPGIFLNGQPFSYGRPSRRKLRRALDQLRLPVR